MKNTPPIGERPEERADAAAACVPSQRHRQAGARQVVLEVLERGWRISGREQCDQLRRRTASDWIHGFLDGAGGGPAVISSVPARAGMHIGRATRLDRMLAS